MILLCIPVLSMFFSMPIQTTPASTLYDARIETDLQAGKLIIRNVFENKSSKTVDLYYKFKCKRHGKSGTSANSQSGSFQAAPGETVILSKTAVSYSPDDNYTVSLDVFNEARTVASDTYSSKTL
ncbi:curli-like amyloid fiber formation chaperone CsgH [Pontibacter sp. H259]|uniref:curli-like amyloid fiber formation chaperone CsgH n=1 Tax=Pontibacter sp. H259 TaxID=3133421 RepID=UPI0030BDC1B6